MIRVVEGAPPAEGMRHRVAGVRHPQQGIARRARSTRRGRPVPCGGGRRENAAARSPSVSALRLATTRPRASVRDLRALGLLNAPGRAGRWARARNLVEGRCHVTSATCRVLVVGASAVRAAVGACPVINSRSVPDTTDVEPQERGRRPSPRLRRHRSGDEERKGGRRRVPNETTGARPLRPLPPERCSSADARGRRSRSGVAALPWARAPFLETAEIHGDRLRFRWRAPLRP